VGRGLRIYILRTCQRVVVQQNPRGSSMNHTVE
jgi:hypothetical protein